MNETELRSSLQNVLKNVIAARSALPAVLASITNPQHPQTKAASAGAVTSRYRAAFDAVGAIETIIMQESTQNVLTAVQKLPTLPPGHVRKRKRDEFEAVSSASVKRSNVTKIELPTEAAFPQFHHKEPYPIDRPSLVQYIRKVNSQGVLRLHIWSRLKIEDNSDRPKTPIYLRVTMPELFIAYIDLEETTTGFGILVITVFGIREKKLPHCSSDFSVFSRMSQFLAGLLQAHPMADIPTIVNLLESYRDLYTEPCVACGQCWSVEGNLPPINRLWVPSTDNISSGHWVPRHYLCSRVHSA